MAVKEYFASIQTDAAQLKKLKDFQYEMRNSVFNSTNQSKLTTTISMLGTALGLVILGNFSSAAAIASIIISTYASAATSGKQIGAQQCMDAYAALDKVLEQMQLANASAVRFEVAFVEHIGEFRYIISDYMNTTIQSYYVNGVWMTP